LRWMGARTQSTVALGLMAQEPTQETRWQGIVRKSKGLAKRSDSFKGEDWLTGRDVPWLGLGLLQAPVLPFSLLHLSARKMRFWE
jgi:hypothetical protein